MRPVNVVKVPLKLTHSIAHEQGVLSGRGVYRDSPPRHDRSTCAHRPFFLIKEAATLVVASTRSWPP
jgi:hypothetical protein